MTPRAKKEKVLQIDPYHVWEKDREWCMACKHSLYEVVENNLPCHAARMFCAVLELGA